MKYVFGALAVICFLLFIPVGCGVIYVLGQFFIRFSTLHPVIGLLWIYSLGGAVIFGVIACSLE